jgi:hypothetical protein
LKALLGKQCFKKGFFGEQVVLKRLVCHDVIILFFIIRIRLVKMQFYKTNIESCKEKCQFLGIFFFEKKRYLKIYATMITKKKKKKKNIFTFASNL